MRTRYLIYSLAMAGLDPATQRARVCGRNGVIGSLPFANWMAASEGGHGEMRWGA